MMNIRFGWLCMVLLWGGAYYGGANVDVQQYTEGQLAIDVYDVSGRKAVWHGVATSPLGGCTVGPD